MFRRSFILWLLIVSPGCANAQLPTAPATLPSAALDPQLDPQPTMPPTTRPTTRPTQRVVSLSSAVRSEQLEQGDWELNMQSQIPFENQTLLFGQLSIYDEDNNAEQTVPVVGYKQGAEIMAMQIDDPRLRNAGWSYICAGPAKNEFWGVLDASLDQTQSYLLLVHSVDAGKTMHLSSLPKPHAACVFDSFCMDRNGHGRISVYVDRTKTRLNHAGYYHFRTFDDGQSWTATQFEPDDMTPAGDAPENTPEPPAKPSRV